jgi:hypothetical protein
VKTLFEGREGLELNWIIESTAYAESFLAFLFVFLIGLAIRNKLRL